MIRYLRHKYALSEKGARDMIKAFIACTLSNIALMAPVSLLYFLISDIMGRGLTDRTIFYIIGIIICLAAIFITTYFQYNATFFATYEESGIRRITLAERLRKLPLSFFGRKDLSDLTSTIMADCARLETASSHWIPELVASLISTSIIAISLFFFDWRMALAALWVLPVYFCIVCFSAKVQKALSRRQMAAKMDCADGIQECLESVRDLKANNAEDKYLEGLDRKIKAVEKRAILSELGAAIFVASSEMFLKIGIATTALVGGILLANGTLDVLTFFMFLLLVSRLYDPMQISLQNLAAIIATNIQCERMNEILEHPTQMGSENLSNKGYDIVFDHVGFAYNKNEQVLRDVSFTAKQGEATALIGPSGGGKTTVSRLAARFWDVTKGKITVGGMDISQVDPETLMSLYSIVFQDVTLFNNSVMENIRIGCKDATDEEVIKAAKLAHVDEFAKKMPNGYHTFIGENGSELSGGERQRISIARAFLKDAPIILMDEATASLDVENETMIHESLSRLMKNKTVLVIAHRMRTIFGSDKIVVLDNGYVVQQGSHAKLIKQDGIYSHMVKIQQQASGWKI
ncbi:MULTISPECIES: ABC transporter ATP-binding protein [Clostridium]|uniref:ABC transporter ATP-binding protein n=1 Tax=Clostridium cadaveris TaxID=1529 RepID=A0A1I2M714_9CLOT|nr:ABC transporter ATP-binding protein [Clostridium cadaveris]MDU4950751.1 ABC transporter ATP-binding protein [Clostridium sp.]MDM8312413.1 ABC transporter ATP-binding protein [Clostridium cadaveris]MDY4948584.1 ABC transporter ATP-binding protein [Clostridium cadaveris]NME63665.1 ABC transporter ATP-binding protein [Clostridium cadaveris]PWL54604.1 MAG: ABC transporter ATP-binding protein [Clostridium cadaveris]